jgi:hypothetical protein
MDDSSRSNQIKGLKTDLITLTIHRGKIMRIRGIHLAALALLLILLGIGVIALRSVRAGVMDLDGSWKLVALAFGDDEIAIVEFIRENGATIASAVDTQRKVLGNAQLKQMEARGDNLTITLSGPDVGDAVFRGKLVKDGPNAGKFIGEVNLRGDIYPASLAKTSDAIVAPLKRNPLESKIRSAMRETDPRSRIKRIEELIEDNQGRPNSQILYSLLLSEAEAAGLEGEKVVEVLKQWSQEAKPYGDAWLNEVRFRALEAIGTSKSFAKLVVELAQEVDKSVSDEALEKKNVVVRLLAWAARHTGMEGLAKDAEARHAKVEGRIDEKYLKHVPPFKPALYPGRKNPKANQVVLMELFTGAECPPCVAADVAFDALLMTYKPAEFIGLQYHLPIPGPDPLTNDDSEQRQNYYATVIAGTPSTLFNGKSEAPQGGSLADSKLKYVEYRRIIDQMLETTKDAEITLSATRSGDQIKIVASARVVEGAGAVSKGEPVLRLALTEESIRYVGGNQVRFHHHVVRAFPGGTKGKDLTAGMGKVELTFDLGDLKSQLESYLRDFAKTSSLSNPLPAVKLENLAVVAFVQDDSDRRVLGAASVSVNQIKP